MKKIMLGLLTLCCAVCLTGGVLRASANETTAYTFNTAQLSGAVTQVGTSIWDAVDHDNANQHWENRDHLQWSADTGTEVAFVLNIPTAGVYDLKIKHSENNDFGSFQTYVDGVALGTEIDCYNYRITVTEEYIGRVNLTAGNHTLSIVTKRAGWFALDTVSFVPASDVLVYDDYDLIGAMTTCGGYVDRQDLSGWSQNGNLWFRGDNIGQNFVFRVHIPEDGSYKLSLGVTLANDFGSYTVKVDDGEKSSPVSLIGDLGRREDEVGTFSLTKGSHYITYSFVEGTNLNLGIDYLKLEHAFTTVSVQKNSADFGTVAFGGVDWKVESGTAEVSETGNGLTVDKDRQFGINGLVMHTKNDYGDFHMHFDKKYNGTKSPSPWLGNTGVLLRSDEVGLDGFWIGSYEWSGLLWIAYGYYRDGQLYYLAGVDSQFGNVGFDNMTYDIYVQKDVMTLILNGWMVESFPLPYETAGKITMVQDSVSAEYSDFSIETLTDDYDIYSHMVRAQWHGYNLAGDMYYWNDAGDDSTFRMALPQDISGVQAYYLARTTKLADNNQTVDVYVDKTGTVAFDGQWTDKAATWQDKAPTCTHGNAVFGLNTVELPVSSFEGVAGGSTVGFYIDKNVGGWYSASEYWLLYKDAAGDIRVADYFNMAYAFDCAAHGFVFAPTNGGEKGYHFFCESDDMLVTRTKGAKIDSIGYPTLTKIGDISYEFAFGEEDKTFNIEDYVKIDGNHTAYKVLCEIDGKAVDAVTLPVALKSGKIKVTLQANEDAKTDASGYVVFPDVAVEINYTTTKAPDRYSVKIFDGDTELYNREVEESTEIDLKPFVQSKVGYVFVGWTCGDDSYAPNAIITVTEAMNVTSKYELKSVTMTFDSLGGSAVEPITQDFGTAVTAPVAPQKEGYDFGGWTNGGEAYSLTTMPAEDITLQAVWTKSADLVAAEGVSQKIAALGNITLESKSAVEEARAEYDALTEKGKSFVEGVSVLTTAETNLAKLIEDDNAVKEANAAKASADRRSWTLIISLILAALICVGVGLLIRRKARK